MARMVPTLFRVGKFGPQKIYIEEKSTMALHLSRFGKFNPWNNFMKLADEILEISETTALVPMIKS